VPAVYRVPSAARGYGASVTVRLAIKA
jgi:hypothetical protein